MQNLTIALPKGRIAQKTLEYFKILELFNDNLIDSRKLILEDSIRQIRYIYVKPIDVLTYVEDGIADIGIVGKDTLMEFEKDVYELLDLKYGKCKFAIAGKKNFNINSAKRRLKVATKYPNVAKRYFEKRGQSVEIIKLNGSVELAPIVGLADVIVDIVETGETLRANGLEVIADICEISSRLVSNKASYRLNYEKISTIVDAMKGGRE